MTAPVQSNARGIAFMCAAMLAFIFNDTLVKLAAGSLPAGEIMALRGIGVGVLFFGLVVVSGHLALVPKLLQPLVIVRSVLEAVVAALYITALGLMPIAELTAIFLTAPLMMTAASALVLKEQVGWRRWCAVTAGFIGALMIVKPSPSGFDVNALLGLASAALAVVRDLLTRRVDPATPSSVVSLGSGLAVTLTGFALWPVETWTMPTTTAWLFLIGAAVVVAIGNYTLIVAFRVGEASALSPFRYMLLVFALVAGMAVFGERPDGASLVGMAIIGASGLYVVHRERLRARAARAVSSDEIRADHQRSK